MKDEPFYSLNNLTNREFNIVLSNRGRGKNRDIIISTMKIVDNWAKEKEYEYVYYFSETGLHIHFYNSPLHREFSAQVDFTDTLKQIEKAFEMR